MPDFVHNLWRDLLFQRRLFVLVAVISLAVFFLLARQVPHGYRAEAWLLLDASPPSTVLAPGATAIRPAAELEIAERQLLTTATLLKVAKENGVYTGLTGSGVAEAMRGSIKTRRLIGGNRANLLHITFLHTDPDTAREVAESLARQVLASDLDRQTARATQAVRFASNAVDRSAEELARLDAKVLTLRQSAAEALPDTIQSRLALRADLQAQLRQVAKDRLSVEARASGKLVAPQAAKAGLLKTQERGLQDTLRHLQETIAATPGNAGRMETLLRRRDLAEQQLSKTQSALSAAQSWQQAIRLEAANRWSLVDVPLPPLNPEGPGKLILIAGSVLFSLLAGVGAVVAAGQFGQPIRSPRQITEILGTGPLLEIPPFQVITKAHS